MIEDKLYTLKELAELTKLTDRTLRNYLSSNILKGHKIGGQWRFNKEEVSALFKNDDFYVERNKIANSAINHYIENKYTFISDFTGCVVMDFKICDKDKKKAFFDKIELIGKNDDIKEKVSFLEKNGHIRMNIVGPIAYIKRVIDLVEQFAISND